MRNISVLLTLQLDAVREKKPLRVPSFHNSTVCLVGGKAFKANVSLCEQMLDLDCQQASGYKSYSVPSYLHNMRINDPFTLLV